MQSRMNRCRQLAVWTPLLCLFSVQAAPDDHAAITKLLNDPNEHRQVISGAGQATVLLQNPCAEAEFSIEKKWVPYRPLSFDSAGKLVAGAWRQVVDEWGCGGGHILNVLVTAEGGGALKVTPLFPGTTHADPALQENAARYAAEAVLAAPGGRERNCTLGYVADTKFLGEEGATLPGATQRPWKELWTLMSCTQAAQVPVQFFPDSTGVTITTGSRNDIKIIRLRP